MFWKKEKNDSLPQEVYYDINDHLIVGKQKKWKKVIEWFFTLLGWFIMLSYVGYVLYGTLAIKKDWYLPERWILNRDMIVEVNRYYFFLLILLLIFFVIFIIWKNYNKNKFGSLHRRQFRPEVTNKELMEKFEMSEEMINMLQNEKIVTLPKNIIPEKLGMGSDKKEDYNYSVVKYHKNN